MCKRKYTIKMTTALVSTVLLLSSCQSTRKEAPVDDYNQTTKIEISENNEITEEIETTEKTESTQESEIIDVTESSEETEIPTESKASETNKIANATKPANRVFTTSDSLNKKTWAESFLTFGNRDDFITMEEVSSVTVKGIKGLAEQKVTYLLRVNTNLAGYGCNVMGAYYIIQFDEDARKALATAAQQYFADFENKKLSTNKKVAKSAYGPISYKLNWGSIKASTPNNGPAIGYCGYEFVKNQPYFILWNYPIPNEYFDPDNGTVSPESNSIKYYFTRNQLKKLIDILSEENLEGYYYN